MTRTYYDDDPYYERSPFTGNLYYKDRQVGKDENPSDYHTGKGKWKSNSRDRKYNYYDENDDSLLRDSYDHRDQ